MDIHTRQLISDIKNEVHLTRHLIGKDKLDPQVISVIGEVPRDQFIPQQSRAMAFYNQPVPIGHGQTISQPYIVALMTDLLAIKKQHNILEIGTGSGYQTAILSRLCHQVYTIERIVALNKKAQQLFSRLNYSNIFTTVGNGYNGWPEHAPYDGIIVTAAASHIPQPLVDQLKPGGNLIIPVGLPGLHQELLLIEKNKHKDIYSRSILGVAFVPLVNDEFTAH